MQLPDFITQKLAARRQEQLFRSLTQPGHLTDFASNDYLGFARSKVLQERIREKAGQYPTHRLGATGSRLISGNTALAEQLEQQIARYHRTEAALLFNSGYDANVGLFACLPQRGDTLLTDELVHASIIDGARLSYARRERFRHNDLQDLEDKLRQASGNIFIGVESFYSMDGDQAPLTEMAALADRYQAYLIVDEAHATGVSGEGGRGLVCALRLEDRVLARIHTFGKALGVHGAAVVGSPLLREYLINFARSFIYTTAQPFHTLLSIQCAYELLPDSDTQRRQLQEHIAFFREQSGKIPFGVLDSKSPIQGVMIPGNENARKAAQTLEDHGYYAKAILSPTVPARKERLRICLHAFNTKEEIEGFIRCLKTAC